MESAPIVSEDRDLSQDYDTHEKEEKIMYFSEQHNREWKIPKNRPVRVYADGVFDLFHIGHANALQQAKKLFPNVYLIVGVCNDKETWEAKGKTVMNEKERALGVTFCKFIDEIVPNSPWIVTPDFMRKHNIDFVSHGEDDSLDRHGKDVYENIKKMDRYITIKRTEGISTSDIIMRIIQNYPAYVKRNASRGYSFEDMHVPDAMREQIEHADS